MKRILLDGPIPVNCYLIEEGQSCYVVDPGFEKEKLARFVKDLGLEVKGILLTHGHFDHMTALDAFDVPIYLHEEERVILQDTYKNGLAYYDLERPYDLKNLKLISLKGGDCLDLGGHPIEVIHTPGHTVGCVCYKYKNELYTGDTLFRGTVGRWDFPSGDLATLQASLVDLIDSQDPETMVYPAHYDSSTIGHEKNTNDFYLQWKRILDEDT